MIYVISGGAKAFAVIGVTYPEGSVCTCTDGTKTLKLKNTSGQGFFLIPYAATWTVTATDGTNTKAVSVEITTEGQSESVELPYNLILYSPETGLASGYIGLTEENGHLKTGTGAYLSPKIDVTDYTVLTITAKTTYMAANGMFITPGLSDGTSIVASATFSNQNETKDIDISGLSGSYYFHGGGNSGRVGEISYIEFK